MITKQESDRKEDLDNLSDFSELILNIIDYYSFINEGTSEEDDIDNWKKGTEYGDKGIVPKELDKKMKYLFKVKADYLIKLENKKIEELNKNENKNK